MKYWYGKLEPSGEKQFEIVGVELKKYIIFLEKISIFLMGIPFVRGIGISWDHSLLIHSHEHQHLK